MEDRERRRFRDFVALAVPAIWLSASPFLLIAFGADLPIAVGAAVFAATFAHTVYGAFLAELGLRLSTGVLGILAAEVLVLVMLVVTLAYLRFSKGTNGHARNRIAGAGRSQLPLISWGLFGYLAFLVAVGSALSPPALAESTLGFFAILFILAAAFLRSRRWNPHHRE